jgi:16S rRNA (cytosine967-C5)-methyltransferase
VTVGPDGRGLPARRAALAALRAIDEDGTWSNLAVPAAIRGIAAPRDRSFAAHLAYETVRWEGTLDWALGTVLTRPLTDVEPALRRILRLGALQLLRSDVPSRAAVDTSVTLAREAVPRGRASGAAGFVNGVLRALVRGVDTLPWPDEAQDPVGALMRRTAHPAWVVEDLLGRYGPERTRAVLAADNDAPGLTLRAVGDRDDLVAELLAEGVDARPGRAPAAVRAPGVDPRTLAAVADGRAVPQDEASQQVVLRTGARTGARALELCAGPGGKATYLAQLVGPAGSVTAAELHPHRAALVREAAARQQLAVDVVVGDATGRLAGVDDGADGYDVVLLDAPCTGLGTGRRRPEIRWRRGPEDTAELAGLQRRLLEAAAARVAPGGTLTYSVCTWTAAETTAVVEDCRGALGAAGLVAAEQVQLLPDRDDTDGMFIATWRREAGGDAG